VVNRCALCANRRSFIALMLLPAPQLREVLKAHKGLKELVSGLFSPLCTMSISHSVPLQPGV
jgi:hypothetical protein